MFFAALPEADTHRQLRAVLGTLEESPGRRVPVGNLHLTLAFAGAVDSATLDCLRAGARRVVPRPIAMRLDRFGCFPRAGVLWLGSNTVPPDLFALAGELAEVLAACQCTYEERPYRPHITLARGVRAVPTGLIAPSVEWRSAGFALMESVRGAEGVRYQALETYGARV